MDPLVASGTKCRASHNYYEYSGSQVTQCSKAATPSVSGQKNIFDQLKQFHTELTVHSKPNSSHDYCEIIIDDDDQPECNVKSEFNEDIGVTVIKRETPNKEVLSKQEYSCSENRNKLHDVSFVKAMMLDDPLKPYKCLVCNERFSQYKHISRHRFSHTCTAGDIRLECWHCSKRFASLSSLRKHAYLVHNETHGFPCPQCKLRFVDHLELRVHSRSCSGNTPQYICSFCGSSLKTFEDLVEHNKNHCYCMFCDARFDDLASLEVHERNSHILEHEKQLLSLSNTPLSNLIFTKSESAKEIGNTDKISTSVINPKQRTHSPNISPKTVKKTDSVLKQPLCKEISQHLSHLPRLEPAALQHFTKKIPDSVSVSTANIVPSNTNNQNSPVFMLLVTNPAANNINTVNVLNGLINMPQVNMQQHFVETAHGKSSLGETHKKLPNSTIQTVYNVHDDSTVTCNLCNLMFASLSHFDEHSCSYNHQTDNKFACRHCGKTLSHRTIRDHELRHMHICKQCGRGFRNETALTIHKRDKCVYRPSSNSLSVRKKPTCEICQRTFTMNSSKKRHLIRCRSTTESGVSGSTPV